MDWKKFSKWIKEWYIPQEEKRGKCLLPSLTKCSPKGPDVKSSLMNFFRWTGKYIIFWVILYLIITNFFLKDRTENQTPKWMNLKIEYVPKSEITKLDSVWQFSYFGLICSSILIPFNFSSLAIDFFYGIFPFRF